MFLAIVASLWRDKWDSLAWRHTAHWEGLGSNDTCTLCVLSPSVACHSPFHIFMSVTSCCSFPDNKQLLCIVGQTRAMLPLTERDENCTVPQLTDTHLAFTVQVASNVTLRHEA
jgi:hypothetical protein